MIRPLYEVLWKNEHARIIRVECGDDFHEALRVYTLAITSNRQGVTLRTCNVAQLPPKKLRPYDAQERLRGGREVLTVRIEPLRHYNLRGVWWCPYCAKLRKFFKRAGFHIEGQYVKRSGYHCGWCGVSHRDMNVRTWNPHAMRLLQDERAA